MNEFNEFVREIFSAAGGAIERVRLSVIDE